MSPPALKLACYTAIAHTLNCMPTDTNNPRTNAINQALQASRERDGNQVLDSLEGIELRTGPGAPLTETYLAAERAYHLGDYAAGVAGFQAYERNGESQTAPAWQRYLSAHRRSWMLFYQGDLVAAERALSEAWARLRAAPELARFEADLEAIEGHLFEAAGEYEQARGRFLRAYERAVTKQHWPLAMSTALDFATLLGHLGRPADASEWIQRAWEAHAQAPDQVGGRVIRLRSARISTQLTEYEEAEAVLGQVIRESADRRSPSTLIDALMARADIARAKQRFADAEADLQAAIEWCDRMGVRAVRVLPFLDLAELYMERGAKDDLGRAQEYFGRALRQALVLKPLHARLAERLTEDLVEYPGLVAKPLSPRFRDSLERNVATLKELTRPTIFQQTERRRRRERALQELAIQLGRLVAGEIRLANSTVFPFSGEVVAGRRRTTIDDAELELLRMLLKARFPGATMREIEAELGVSYEAAKKRLQRLARAIGNDLVSRRRGRAFVYSVERGK